jgi:hypothetical protein
MLHLRSLLLAVRELTSRGFHRLQAIHSLLGTFPAHWSTSPVVVVVVVTEVPCQQPHQAAAPQAKQSITPMLPMPWRTPVVAVEDRD